MKERQFSIRLLLGLVTVAAVVSLIAAARYRKLALEKGVAQFVAAIYDTDVEKVDRLLKADPTLAHGRMHGNVEWPETALQMAVACPKVFDRILQEQPDLEETSELGETVLSRAGADPRIEIPPYWDYGHSLSLLDIVLSRGHTEIAIALIKGGANPNGLSDRWGTPLHMVLQWSVEPPVFDALLKNGADVDVRHDGMSVRERAEKQRAINNGSQRFQRYIDLLDAHDENR